MALDSRRKLVRYIDLIYFKKKLDEYLDKKLAGYVQVSETKGLSTNDFDDTYKSFLDRLISNSDEYISEDEIDDMFDDDPDNHILNVPLTCRFTVEK